METTQKIENQQFFWVNLPKWRMDQLQISKLWKKFPSIWRWMQMNHIMENLREHRKMKIKTKITLNPIIKIIIENISKYYQGNQIGKSITT